MVEIGNAFVAARRNSNDKPVPQHRHAQDALTRNKREGMDLAVKARVAALGITAVMLVFLNPNWDVIWYLGLLLCLVLVGLAQRRVGQVGQSRAELGLLFLDLLLMTVALLFPNPLQDRTVPTALIYQFEVFQYFYFILAAGVLSYSWRTVVAIGTWTSVMWLLGAAFVWWFGHRVPSVSQAAKTLFPDFADLSRQLDPNLVHWDLRIQEVVVFLVVAGILAVTVRRYQNLVLDSAETARERANLSRYFSPSIVDVLSQKDEPLGHVRTHDAEILFVDIAGFTAYADGRDPRFRAADAAFRRAEDQAPGFGADDALLRRRPVLIGATFGGAFRQVFPLAANRWVNVRKTRDMGDAQPVHNPCTIRAPFRALPDDRRAVNTACGGFVKEG